MSHLGGPAKAQSLWKKRKKTFHSNQSRSLGNSVSCESAASRLCISHGCTFSSVLMLSSGLWSPFNYIRQVRDGPSIIYMAGIQGEIRDIYSEERREEEWSGEMREGHTEGCGFKKMRNGGGGQSGCREKM